MAYYHPQFVHFAIALLVVGVVLRALSLIGRPPFVAPAALTLLAVGTIAAALAVQSGTAAHGPVERIPGARNAVVEHEEWGIRTRNVFYGVIAIEAVALLMGRWTGRAPRPGLERREWRLAFWWSAVPNALLFLTVYVMIESTR